jgi:UDP-2,3-diacylglucosamine pyrophosphatase LpxH
VSGGNTGEFEEPLRIVSDLHLGHPNSMFESVERLRPLIEGARTMVFNGDTCELAYQPWINRSQELLESLRGLCEEMGVHPVFLTGNHDFAISETGWLELEHGEVMVTHGDMLVREVVPWSHQYLLKKPEVREMLRLREGMDDTLKHRWQTVRMVEEILESGSGWKASHKEMFHRLKTLWPPERLIAILQGWLTMFGAAERFVERFRPEAKVFIFGHFHRAGIRTRGGRLYCNTGAYMRESRQMVVDLEDGWLTVRPVVSKGHTLRLGPAADVWRLGRTARASEPPS